MKDYKNVRDVLKDYELGDHVINDNMESLELFKKGHKYGAGYIRFLFDHRDSTLIITGDYGDAIFHWYSSKNTLTNIAGYTKDIGYFASKCSACSEPIYIYDLNKAQEDVDYWLDECDISDSDFGVNSKNLHYWDSKDAFITAVVNCIDVVTGFSIYNLVQDFNHIDEEVLNSIDEDWWESVYDFGKKVNPIFETYSNTLNLGIKLLKRQEAKK